MQETQPVAHFLKEKSPEAFEGVVDENIDMLRRFAYRILLNENDADDVVQETFLAAFDKAGEFRGGSKFSTWLCSIAYNKSMSLIREKARLRHSGDGEDAEQVLGKITSKDAADKNISSSESMETINRAIQDLPEHLRAAICLTAVDGKEMDEAAFILGCPKPTLYWRLHKARKILGQKLKDLLK